MLSLWEPRHSTTASAERTYVDEELGAERDEVGVVHRGRDGDAAGTTAVHEAQAAQVRHDKRQPNPRVLE